MDESIYENSTARFQYSAIRIQCCYRKFKAHRYIETLTDEIYEKYYDEKYQTFYYYNKISGQSTWFKPKLLGVNRDIKLSEYAPNHHGSSACSIKELNFYKQQFQSVADNDDLLIEGDVYELFRRVIATITRGHVCRLIQQVAPHLVNKWDGINFEVYLRVVQAQKPYSPHAISMYHIATFGLDLISSLQMEYERLDPNYITNWYRSLPRFLKSGYPTMSIANQHNAIDLNGFLYLLETILQLSQHSTHAALSIVEILESTSQWISMMPDTSNAPALSVSNPVSSGDAESKTPQHLSLSKFISMEQLYSRFQNATGDKLQLRTIFPGDAVHFPKVGQSVCIHYSCKYATEIIESTYSRDKSLEFRVGAGHLIVGFDRGIRMMSLGETCLITISPELAYGADGKPPRIPPNAQLVFRVELIGIRDPNHVTKSEETDRLQ